MAATTITTATETILAKVLTDMLIDAMYGSAVMDSVMRQESLVGKPSNAYSFPVWPSLTAASIGETTDLTSTAVDTTNVDISVAESAAIRVDVTDLLNESSIVSDGARFAEQGGKAVADKRDVDATALLAAFSTVVGTSGADLSEANFLAAHTALTNADAPRPYVAVFHTQQIGDLRAALMATQASVQNNTDPNQLGLEFTYNGIPIYSSTNVGTANAGADRAGAIFARGQALARVTKRAIRMEPQRDASLRSWEYNITSVYGQGELVDGWGVSVITDA